MENVPHNEEGKQATGTNCGQWEKKRTVYWSNQLKTVSPKHFSWNCLFGGRIAQIQNSSTKKGDQSC